MACLSSLVAKLAFNMTTVVRCNGGDDDTGCAVLKYNQQIKHRTTGNWGLIKWKWALVYGLGLGTHLFVKVPQPGDSEGTFSIFELSFYLLLSI